jgi:hypothetical protein
VSARRSDGVEERGEQLAAFAHVRGCMVERTELRGGDVVALKPLQAPPRGSRQPRRLNVVA